MKKVMIAISAAAIALGSACLPSYAAPIAPIQTAATPHSNLILAYYYQHRYYPYRWHGHYYRYRWHGHYYPYYWHGHYYRHRYYRYGHYYYR